MIILSNSAEVMLNTPRIYASIAQFLAVFFYIKYSSKKYSNNITIGISIISLIVFVLFHHWALTWPLDLWIFGMFLSFVLMFLNVFLLTKYSVLVSSYITILAFIISELVASITWQLEYFLIVNNFNDFVNVLVYSPLKLYDYNLSISIIMIIMYALFFALLNPFEKRYQHNLKGFDVKINDLMTAIVTAILVFSISNFSFLNINSPISSTGAMEIFYIRTLVNLVGFILLYSLREHNYSAQKTLEVDLMKRMLDNQYNQYQVSMKSIDTINRKYHDLKHFIELIKNELDYEKKIAHITEFENSIKSVENTYQTNNREIDVIINSKEESLRENNINITVVANAEKLNFISTIDIVSIFSNAIDNAIDSLKLVKDNNKRLLKLAIVEEKGFIIIKMENYYETQIKIDKGRFLTTKLDDTYHGYGIRSMQHAVEKYNGMLTIDTKNNWFTVVIAIPLPTQ